MTLSEALDIISNFDIPCADRLRAAMAVNLEPRNCCGALQHADLELRRLRFLRLAEEEGRSPEEREMLIEQADALLSIPF